MNEKIGAIYQNYSCFYTTGYQMKIEKWFLKQSEHNEIVFKIRANLNNWALVSSLLYQLPCIIVSGRFPSKNVLRVDLHSKLIYLSVPLSLNLSFENIESLKNEITKIPYIRYCGLNTFGTGLDCVVEIDKPELHIFIFKSIEVNLLIFSGITIEKKGMNCFTLVPYSYDNNPYLNPDSEVFKGAIIEDIFIESTRNNEYTIKLKTPRPKKYGSSKIDYDNINQKDILEEIIPEIINLKVNLVQNDKESFDIGCIIANNLKESGRAMYLNLCKFNPLNDVEEDNFRYDKCLTSKYQYKIKSFFEILKNHRITIKD